MEIKTYEESKETYLTKKSYGNDELLEERVRGILAQVKAEGDEALFALTQELDGVDLRKVGLRVTEEEIRKAYEQVEDGFLQALRQAKDNIYAYHFKQKRTSWLDAKEDGSILGQLLLPLERVGIYVPGGTAAYPSSVLMNALPAVVAGVK